MKGLSKGRYDETFAGEDADYPSLADEIAEPRPDMNIKVAAFTVSENSSNTFT